MDNHKDKLRSVVEEYWRKELPDSKERAISLKIESDLINDIVGPRRTGKTYLMYFTIKKLLDTGIEKEAAIQVVALKFPSSNTLII
ncbi:MAG: hypothetical protein KKD69_02565 [Euryarchaeota archaeon]|nr:hypothetical protein [Euryarchaeota archaeon]